MHKVGWIGLLLLAGAAGVGLALGLPALQKSRRAHNERNASAILYALRMAQEDFRKNDADGNGVNDYWTADVAGLGIVLPLQKDGTIGARAIGLIDPAIASADGDFAFARREYSAQGPQAARSFPRFGPQEGYLFRAARTDGIAAPPLRDDTDPTPHFGRTHNRERFALIAYPIHLGKGRLVFIVNQDGSQMKINLGVNYSVDYAGTEGESSSEIRSSGERHLDAGEVPINPTGVGYAKFS